MLRGGVDTICVSICVGICVVVTLFLLLPPPPPPLGWVAAAAAVIVTVSFATRVVNPVPAHVILYSNVPADRSDVVVTLYPVVELDMLVLSPVIERLQLAPRMVALFVTLI